MVLKSEWALHRANQVGGVVWMQHTDHATVVALLVVRAWLAVIVIENVAHRGAVSCVQMNGAQMG